MEKLLDKRNCQSNVTSTPNSQTNPLIHPSQKKLTSFFKPNNSSSCNVSLESTNLNCSSENREFIQDLFESTDKDQQVENIKTDNRPKIKKITQNKNVVKSTIQIITRSNSKKLNQNKE